MTNHWNDIAHSDCILIIGSNAAENHPISFKWVTRAKEKGAAVISVDPRFTRTSAASTLYAPLRPGTDIAFIGAIINHALENDLVHREYLITHTNASFLVDPRFSLQDGVFGPIENGQYTKAYWGFQEDENGIIRKDTTLSDENCVFQVLKRHFSRYTMDKCSQITGTPIQKLRQVAETFCATHKPDKVATIMYAMGATQHTHGTQNIRSYAILQLLMGNIGLAGGGINALRGESNVQGSTDHGLLFHLLPGYLKCPLADNASLQTYLDRWTPRTNDPKNANWWGNTPKYMVSLLKAFWGDHATKNNEFAYRYLPKQSGDYSFIALFEAMRAGKIKGAICMGQNPVVGGPNSNMVGEAIDKLDWLVAADLWETETSIAWKRPGVDPARNMTEYFLLPAASSMEKEGSVTNSGRWAQWRYKAVDPPGDARSDLWIMDRLFQAIRKRYTEEDGVFPDPILHLAWNYGTHEEPDAHLVAKEINGYFLEDRTVNGKAFKKGDLVPSFLFLQDDGSTSSGNWLYCGGYTNAGNMMARRQRSNPADDPADLNPNWAWCWPVNRRILYNRASCDAQGKPWAPARAFIHYDRSARKWVGDVPDGGWPPLLDEEGHPDAGARHSFLMLPEGRACLFAPTLVDGPLPEHYEPMESPVANLMSRQQSNPMVRVWRPDQIAGPDRYPIIATTYRVTEHWQAGAMTRSLPVLSELVPVSFVEMSEELAEKKGIKNGDWVTVTSARGTVRMKAVVTIRIKPMRVAGKTVEMVGMIWHFGYAGLATGDIANLLTSYSGDANTGIPEFKAFLCDITKGSAR